MFSPAHVFPRLLVAHVFPWHLFSLGTYSSTAHVFPLHLLILMKHTLERNTVLQYIPWYMFSHGFFPWHMFSTGTCFPVWNMLSCGTCFLEAHVFPRNPVAPVFPPGTRLTMAHIFSWHMFPVTFVDTNKMKPTPERNTGLQYISWYTFSHGLLP